MQRFEIRPSSDPPHRTAMIGPLYGRLIRFMEGGGARSAARRSYDGG